MKITYFGSELEINEAIRILKQLDLSGMKAPEARLTIQRLIDEHHLRASILVNGKTVWSKDRILSNLDRIIKCERLYNLENQSKPPILSHYFYHFLSLVCGSSQHYDIHGWIHVYPTAEHLKKFFQRNEFGKSVLDWIPEQYTDARVIVEEIEMRLCPFASYMKAQEAAKSKRK